MGSTTATGTAIAISAAVPATQTEAGYTALTFTEIGGVEKLGPIGANVSKITFQPLKGALEKHKGPADYGSLSPTMAHDETDAGQVLLRTASEPGNNALYAFKVTYPNGAIRYFQARVFGYQDTAEGAESLVMGATMIEICTPIIKKAAV